MSVLPAAEAKPDFEIPLVIIGAGACGQIAALQAKALGVDLVVLERDPVPQGSTALSSGMIPACETKFQRAEGVDDSVAIMVADVMGKNKGEADVALVEAVCRESGPTIDWLADQIGIPLILVGGFLYPNHSKRRMHAPPSISGAALVGSLTNASAAAGVDILTDAHVTDIYADADGRVTAVRYARPDGGTETIGCQALILACNGFGGNPRMVERYIPEMSDALYFGHTGNQGDAMVWGEALGAALADMTAYQGHGSVAHPHGALISWAIMMEGGIQVNLKGERFSNEHGGYSEQAVHVLAQPERIAWNIFDGRLHELASQFEDYRGAVEAGALITADTAGALAQRIGVPPVALEQTLENCAALAAGRGADAFGRDFTGAPALSPPYHAIRVTGALFHTQGGLAIDTQAHVLRPDGSRLPNLFAGGGAARGLSGAHVWGYLSGNGLLPATTLGRIAGRSAAGLLLK